MGGWMWFGWLGGAVVLVLVLWLVVRAMQRGQEPALHDCTPEEELKHRYARGEISREEYERMLEDLRE